MAIPASTAQLRIIPSADFTKEDKPIGQGGFGSVYRGKWQNRTVAIKELFVQDSSTQFYNIFKNEADVMVQCRHAHIVQLIGICEEQNKFAFIMEYLERGSLYHLLQDSKIDIPWSQRYQTAVGIGEGLRFLHSKSVIHRDLKSLNILLDKGFTAKISDFGLAEIRLATSSHSKVPVRQVGSTRWMAPELFKPGGKANKNADIYSFGMVLWEIATRRVPFSEASNEMQVMAWKMNNTHEQIPPQCSQEYANVIKKCWNDPRDRPPAEQLVLDLKELQGKSRPDIISKDSYRSNDLSTKKNTFSKDPYVSNVPGASVSLQNGEISVASITTPVSSVPKVPSLPAIAFGKAEWAKLGVDVGDEPRLPSNIHEILNGPCRIWKGKKVEDTHLLVLIPEKVNGRPYSLSILPELIKNFKSGYKTQFKYLETGCYDATTPVKASYWVLLTRDVIPDSRNELYNSQCARLEAFPNYCRPKVIEVVTGILGEYFRRGIKLFPSTPWTFTSCEEYYSFASFFIKTQSIVVGGFGDDGLRIYDDEKATYKMFYTKGGLHAQEIGIAGAWRL